MALIQFTYVSNVLLRSVPVQVILPVDKLSPEGEYLPLKKYKTLYLLNGLWGSHMDWVSGTRIQRWAEERDLAVVMPPVRTASMWTVPASTRTTANGSVRSCCRSPGGCFRCLTSGRIPSSAD